MTGISEAAESSTSYSIVLSSSPGSNLKWTPKKSFLFEGRIIYVEETIISSKQWERLCLGFFDNRKQAASLLKEIKNIYSGAWIKQSSKQDIKYKVAVASPVTSVVSGKKLPGKQATLTDKQLDSLMQRAKQEFTDKKYSSAVRYFTALISAGEHKYARDALELLGLSRQRKGQTAHAVDMYEKYLSIYPEGDGSDRVRQRLAGLLTAARSPKDKIRMLTDDEGVDISTFGSFSQFYRNNKASIDGTEDITTLSQLISFIDVTTVRMAPDYTHRYQFAADHTYDFIGNGDSSEYRFIETYYELSHNGSGNSGRLGRQALRIGGILKRFDGLSAGYQFTPDMRLNVLGGLPVDIDNKASFNDHKTFYGVTFESGIFFKYLEINPFYFNQKVDGLTDMESTGTEVRYQDESKAFFGMVDYDLFHKSVNIFQFNTNFIFEQGRTAYMNAFLRKTPGLATSNALIGQDERTIDELKQRLNIEQIYQLARDRSARSQTVTIGGSQPVDQDLQVAADVTLSRVGDTVASGGVPVTTGTGTDYFLSAQLVGNNLLMQYDTGVLGVRYIDTEPSNTTSLIVNARFPLTNNWRINPRLQYDIRNLMDGRSQKKARYLLRTDYQYIKKVRFDFELGYDDTSESSSGQSLGSNNLFFSLGYRWDF